MLGRIKTNKKTLIILLVLILVACSVVAALELTNRIDLFGKAPVSKATDEKAKTTSDAATAQADFSDGNDRQPSTSADKANATVRDTSGSGQPSAGSPGVSSADQVITVYSPVANSLLTNGSSITGKAAVPRVSFRLIDNVSGVIATGSLGVVNGNFSGVFNFSSNASQGRLDIFSTRADGMESSVVEIPVRFK